MECQEVTIRCCEERTAKAVVVSVCAPRNDGDRRGNRLSIAATLVSHPAAVAVPWSSGIRCAS